MSVTLSGSIPGLLRRGSPVVLDGTAGTVCGIRLGMVLATVGLDMRVGKAETCHLPVADFAIDLTDATGRAHAVWWLAQQCGFNMALSVHYEVETNKRGVYSVAISNEEADRWWYAPVSAYPEEDHCPGLSALHGAAYGLLNDGSRWVDAEALRLVCLHVANVLQATKPLTS